MTPLGPRNQKRPINMDLVSSIEKQDTRKWIVPLIWEESLEILVLQVSTREKLYFSYKTQVLRT